MADETPKSESKKTVYLLGSTRGAEHGEARKVDAATAERLVRDRLASYTKQK